MPLIVSRPVVAAALRASQGSSTVAIVTTLGLLGAAVTAGDYTVIQVSLLALANGFGALGYLHVNDSDFWVVTRFLGLPVGDRLRAWTARTTALGVAGFSPATCCGESYRPQDCDVRSGWEHVAKLNGCSAPPLPFTLVQLAHAGDVTPYQRRWR